MDILTVSGICRFCGKGFKRKKRFEGQTQFEYCSKKHKQMYHTGKWIEKQKKGE